MKYEEIYKIDGEIFFLSEEKVIKSEGIINHKDEYEDDEELDIDSNEEYFIEEYNYETKYALLKNPNYHNLIVSYCNDLEEDTDFKVNNISDLILFVINSLSKSDKILLLDELKNSSVYVSKIPGGTSDVLIFKDLNIEKIEELLDKKDDIIYNASNPDSLYKYRIYENGKIKKYIA